MRATCTVLLATAFLSACAPSVQPALAQAVPVAIARTPAIADAEPDVTAQVAATLGRVRGGTLAPEELSDNARAALPAAQLQKMGAALQGCASPPALELLVRTTKGEDRNYRYRALCGSAPLVVDIVFNKGGRIAALAVTPE